VVKATDPVDACTGYEIIDIERLLRHFESSSQSNLLEKAREWATAWNSIVGHVYMCACIFLRCGSESHCFIPLPSSMTWPSTKRINSAKQERS
jgi:hypothetical protein